MLLNILDSVYGFFFCPDQGELAYPVHHMVLETTFGNQGSELSSATIIPHMTLVAGLTRSEDKLSLKPDGVYGFCIGGRKSCLCMEGSCIVCTQHVTKYWLYLVECYLSFVLKKATHSVEHGRVLNEVTVSRTTCLDFPSTCTMFFPFRKPLDRYPTPSSASNPLPSSLVHASTAHDLRRRSLR